MSDVTWEQIFGLIFNGNELDVLAATPAPDPAKPQRQITPATPEDIEKMKDMGEKAILLKQEIEDLLRPVAGQIKEKQKALKAESDELLDKLMGHGLDYLKIEGLGTIEVETKKDKKKTLEELKRILKPEEGLRVWKQLTVVESHRLRLPDPAPPEA